MSEEKYSTLPVDTARVLLGPITNIAAMAAGAYAIAYVLGYSYHFAYFSEAGALWILGLFPAATILQPVTMWGVALLAGVAALLWPTRHAGTRSADIRRMAYWLAGLTVAFGALYSVARFAFGGLLESLFGTLALCALAFSLVEFLIYIVARITEDDADTAKVRTFGLMLGLTLVTMLICNTLGTQAARRDFDIAKSQLAVARLKSRPVNAPWRVVSVISSDAVVLVKIGTQGRHHVFRVVDAHDVATIEAVKY